ncbi:MAG TPA: hypothetical protein VK629_00170 [Steroidobacteraceae bacterium]|nr:hypothetical protein [Steroidobacteraceae bacterium]
MTQKFERVPLYEEVWKEPITRLAKKYNLSDNGLRKICDTLNIPLPERGHWARIAAGHQIPIPPLSEGPTQSTYFSVRAPYTSPDKSDEDDLWLRERTAFETSLANRINVNLEPAQWHPLIRELRSRVEAEVKKLERSRRADEASERRIKKGWSPTVNMDGYDWRSFVHSGQLLLNSHRACAFRASIANRQRGLAIANTFFFESEARGYSVTFSAKDGRYKIEGHGGRVDLRISEKLLTKTRKVRRYDGKLEDEKYREPSECLGLYLEIGYFSGAQFSDAPGAVLQDQLNRVFIALSKLVVRCRVRTRKEEIDRIERQRLEEEAAARRKVAEEERQRIAAERARRRALYRETARWSKAVEVRRYIEHLSSISTGCATSPDFDQWRSWAKDQADRLDPSRERLTGDFMEIPSKPGRSLGRLDEID